MAEIHINPADIELLIKSYCAINNDFVLSNYCGSENKKICSFFIKGKPCKMQIFIKKNSVRIISVGQNKEEGKALVDYIRSKGYSTNIETKQFTFVFSDNALKRLFKEIQDTYEGLISYTEKGNMYKFEGYNKDYLTFTYYPSTKKAMIQGRPYYVFNVIMTILSDLDEYSIEDIVMFNNGLVDNPSPYTAIRELMISKLGKAYSYLDNPLLKSISGAICQQSQKLTMEDYTGCLMGVFKALEGYLKKLLTQEFGYTLKNKDNFFMFKKRSGIYEIENNIKIERTNIEALIKLYLLYKHKRNVFSHATVDPSMTRIIENKSEALEISDEILDTINNTYKTIFGE